MDDSWGGKLDEIRQNGLMSVFHLKYRPQRVCELDLPDVSEKLKKLLEAKEIPQTWLFAGPKGSGKTSAARIVARAINCLKPQGVEPCNECVNDYFLFSCF